MTKNKRTEKTISQQPNGLSRHFKKNLIRSSIIVLLWICMYLTVVYSNIPLIAKWRTIYIETAMTTNSHQWLATLFFPQSVIDKVMDKRSKDLDAQIGLDGNWEDVSESPEAAGFFSIYWELDTESVRSYLKKHPELYENGYGSIRIVDFDKKLGLKTVKDDTVLVVDTAHDLIILGVEGEGYQGKLAIIKDASRVDLAKSTALGSYGQEIDSFCETNDAILGINASGFKDVDGEGTGGQVKGCLVIDGVDYHKTKGDITWKFFGLQEDNRMYITDYSAGIESKYRWAMEFFPALIVNGESVVDGTYGMGIQPRSTIGQTKNGDMLLLVVDGRQVGYSLGCTVADCTDIMLRYDAYQGMNLDGGSSSVMWYDGNFITSSCSVTGRGRYMPDAIVVKRIAPDEEAVIIDAVPAY